MTKVGLVLVAHSAKLAEGLADVVAEMAPEVVVVPAGGRADGGIGTDYDAVAAALGRADNGAGAVLLYDLGSAQMTAELAVEMLGDPDSVVVAEAPLVEGAIAAAVAAQGGADCTAVAHAAVAAAATIFGGVEAEPFAGPPSVVDTVAVGSATERSMEIVLTNEIGLHARPAALLAHSIAGLDATVTIRFGDRVANASSVMGVMTLGARQGDRIEITASGRDADEVLRRVGDLVARDFNPAN
jgi:PTS hybrid protein